LNDLQLRVRQLLDQVEQITKEQNYQRYREERFRQTSEGTNVALFIFFKFLKIYFLEPRFVVVCRTNNCSPSDGLVANSTFERIF